VNTAGLAAGLAGNIMKQFPNIPMPNIPFPPGMPGGNNNNNGGGGGDDENGGLIDILLDLLGLPDIQTLVKYTAIAGAAGLTGYLVIMRMSK